MWLFAPRPLIHWQTLQYCSQRCKRSNNKMTDKKLFNKTINCCLLNTWDYTQPSTPKYTIHSSWRNSLRIQTCNFVRTQVKGEKKFLRGDTHPKSPKKTPNFHTFQSPPLIHQNFYCTSFIRQNNFTGMNRYTHKKK